MQPMRGDGTGLPAVAMRDLAIAAAKDGETLPLPVVSHCLRGYSRKAVHLPCGAQARTRWWQCSGTIAALVSPRDPKST